MENSSVSFKVITEMFNHIEIVSVKSHIYPHKRFLLVSAIRCWPLVPEKIFYNNIFLSYSLCVCLVFWIGDDIAFVIRLLFFRKVTITLVNKTHNILFFSDICIDRLWNWYMGYIFRCIVTKILKRNIW